MSRLHSTNNDETNSDNNSLATNTNVSMIFEIFCEISSIHTILDVGYLFD